MNNKKKKNISTIAFATILAALVVFHPGGGTGGVKAATATKVEPTTTSQIEVSFLNTLVDQANFSVENKCSGTLIDVKQKLILTNYHCVADKVSVVDHEVTLPSGRVVKIKKKKYEDVNVKQNQYKDFALTGTRSYQTEIVAENVKVDLALLKIKADEIPQNLAAHVLPKGYKVIRGEVVYSVGNPLGQDATLNTGIVSNVNRTFEFPWTEGAKLPMIQFSGGIAGGSSGGALYNQNGQLVGVPAARAAQTEFIGLAIPYIVIQKFLDNHCYTSVYDEKADDKVCREKKEKEEKKLTEG